MEKLFAKIFSILLVISFCFVGTGCIEFNFFDDLWEKYENGEISEDEYYEELEKQQTIPLYGTKVLYRPDNYDFSGNSGGTESQQNDYYGQYAWQILRRLELIYGVADNSHKDLQYEENDIIYKYFNFDNVTLPYLYDSIRYQVDEYAQVTNSFVYNNNTWTDETTKMDTEHSMLSANLDNAWNWSFDRDGDNLSPYLYYIYGEQVENVNNENYVKTIFKDGYNDVVAGFEGYYSGLSSNYRDVYLGTSTALESQTEFYSDFVKTLEYVIYCYSLDLTPGQVVVTPNYSNGKYYQVVIYETSNGQQIAKTPTDALDDIKEVFNKIGSYVGIAERNKDKIIQWILDNVIGQKAMSNDKVVEYSGATEIVYNGKTYVVVSAEDAINQLTEAGVNLSDNDKQFLNTNIKTASETTKDVGRAYASTVKIIVDKVCNQVSIGSGDGGNVEVDERYLASEIMEYYGEAFTFNLDDEPFPYYEDFTTGAGARAIRPLEYQSAVLMFKEEVSIDALVIAFQYDADLDGYQTATGNTFDGSRYLEIEVGLNFFDHETGEKTVVDTKKVIVPDGKLTDPFGDSDLEKLSKETAISFSQSAMFGFDEPILGDSKKDLVVGPFNVDIGNGILKTDVGENSYKGNPFVSKKPITFQGNTAVKDYYEILEPTEEQIASGNTYLSGQLDANKFKGSDGCDYLEITYRVIKKVGDTSTNYKFYTGLSIINS